ncbi:hypothetical protein EV126DRAFT_157353 [Verticillium dahliae]|nr:hypothetical protein EV126DRAFT_157353 [Verticillium dahliae]
MTDRACLERVGDDAARRPVESWMPSLSVPCQAGTAASASSKRAPRSVIRRTCRLPSQQRRRRAASRPYTPPLPFILHPRQHCRTVGGACRHSREARCAVCLSETVAHSTAQHSTTHRKRHVKPSTELTSKVAGSWGPAERLPGMPCPLSPVNAASSSAKASPAALSPRSSIQRRQAAGHRRAGRLHVCPAWTGIPTTPLFPCHSLSCSTQGTLASVSFFLPPSRDRDGEGSRQSGHAVRWEGRKGRGEKGGCASRACRRKA